MSGFKFNIDEDAIKRMAAGVVRDRVREKAQDARCPTHDKPPVVLDGPGDMGFTIEPGSTEWNVVA